MIDAQTLLNPDLQNRELRAFAYLSTQFRQGTHNPIDCLIPFAVHALAEQEGNQVDWGAAKEFLKSKYSINIPYYMLDQMSRPLTDLGAIEKSSIGNILIARNKKSSLSQNSVDLSTTDIDNFGIALSLYAKSRGRENPLTADSWSDIIIPFFQGKSPPKDKKNANVDNVIVTNPKSIDFTIVADFIVHNFANKLPLYNVIRNIFYGVLVADFLTHIENVGRKKSLVGLNVFYDSPVILRLLGCSGTILKNATEELHEELRDLGCRIYFFHHTYDEVFEAIEALIKCHENNVPMFRETHEAIARGELTIKELYAIRSELDLRLKARLGIVESGTTYSNRNVDRNQISESDFVSLLKQKGGWTRPFSLAPERDAMSLAMIMRLRAGKTTRDISKALYLFITHNARLAWLSREFLIEERYVTGRSIWPIMTVGQMSTIAWVMNEKFDNDEVITKELIANCYEARLPDDDFDDRLREFLEKSAPEEVSDLYNNAFLVSSVRDVALSSTTGNSALIRTVNAAELLSRATADRDAIVDQARSDERKLVEELAANESANLAEQKAHSIAETLSIGISWFIAALFLAGTMATLGIFGSSASPFWLTLIVGILSAFAFLDSFKLLGPHGLRVWVKRGILRLIRKAQAMLLP